VHKRAPIKGVPPDTHVLFISHREPEMQEAPAKSGMWGASQAFQSRINMYEVGADVCHAVSASVCSQLACRLLGLQHTCIHIGQLATHMQ
jgi:hypothetical protein